MTSLGTRGDTNLSLEPARGHATPGSTRARRAFRLTRKDASVAVVILTVMAAAGCGPRMVFAPRLGSGPVQLSDALSQHVVLVSLDGLRPDAIEAFGLPTLQRLVREGSYTLSATTVLPSKTLPSHVSMLTGVFPDRHQILWNRAVAVPRDRVKAPTIFEIARGRGLRTAAFFSKAKFRVLQRPGALDHSQVPGGWFGRWSSEQTASTVEAYLVTARPHLLFVHFPEPDSTGHRQGWMTDAYARAARLADAALARVLRAAGRAFGEGRFTLIVTADHGGHDTDHGSSDARDVTIPWVAWGQGVAAGQLPDGRVRTVDSASTVLWLLGIDSPPGWSGKAVTEAFDRRGRED